MRDHDPVIAAIDGPPGAGKTSLLARLVPAYRDRCLFFTEPNARLRDMSCPPLPGSAAASSLWFLQQEEAKARSLAALTADPRTSVLLADRNHLGALAYCHAARDGDALPYDRARAFYLERIAPHLPRALRTIILLTSPRISLARRGGTPERPRWAPWFSPELLARLHDFYLNLAPGLCPSPPVIIDTDQLTAAEVRDKTLAVLADAGLPPPSPAPSPGPGRPALDPVFTRLYTRLGGLETFGHPLTRPFTHRGATVQICQLAALHRDPAGQARVWDPLTRHSAVTR